MSEEAAIASISSEFDVFAPKSVQASVHETTEVAYKPIASVEQTDLEFLIPADSDTNIDLNIKLYIRGKRVKEDGKDLDATDHTVVTNNLLHSLFSQCTVSLNGISITQAIELYPYRSYLETILTYGTDAAFSHLTNAFCYLDDGDLLTCDPNAAYDTNTNRGFIARWNKIKQSKKVQLYVGLHSDICNVSQYLLPGVRLQIKFTKARQSFFFMNTKTDAKFIFNFLDAQLLVNGVRPNPAILLAHNTVLSKGGIARHNLTRVELKTFSFFLKDLNHCLSIMACWDLSRNVFFSPC
jgi:hypothetical protein